MIDVNLFSGQALNILPKMLENCVKDNALSEKSLFIKKNFSQSEIKEVYFFTAKEWLKSESYKNIHQNYIDDNVYDQYVDTLDVYWYSMDSDTIKEVNAEYESIK